MTIDYIKKNVYGVERIYIKDKEMAATITALTNKKTLDKGDLVRFGRIGVQFKQVLDEE